MTTFDSPQIKTPMENIVGKGGSADLGLPAFSPFLTIVSKDISIRFFKTPNCVNKG